jgi:hypothetical protein
MEPKYTDTVSGEELYINVDSYGSTYYFKDKKKSIQHRVDGPAIEFTNGSKEWYVEGKRHRLDGPAVEYDNGSKMWYVDGVFIFSVDSNNKLVVRMR